MAVARWLSACDTAAAQAAVAGAAKEPVLKSKRQRQGKQRKPITKNLVGLTREELASVLEKYGLSSNAADTIAVDIHRHGVTDVSELRVAKRHRHTLARAGFYIKTGTVVRRQVRCCVLCALCASLTRVVWTGL